MGVVAVDCFSGAGGATRGFLNVGIRVVKGVDNDPGCRETYERNNSPAKFVCADIFDLSADDVVSGLKLRPSDHLLLAGCAPCQPFSCLRKKRGASKGKSLLMQFARLVTEIRPEFVFVENVPGLQHVSGNSAFARFVIRLERLGYFYDHAVINAMSYGVPQSRKRLILVASQSAPISLPEPTHGPERRHQPFVTVRATIADYPALAAGDTSEVVANHAAMSLSPLNLKRIGHTPKDGGDRRSWPKRLWLNCHRPKHTGHTDVYGRMWWDRPAPALTCRCVSLSNGRYGHPTQDRALSLREAAALQTFPDDFTFFGSTPQSAHQIGNAVPVRLSELVGDLFRQHSRRIVAP